MFELFMVLVAGSWTETTPQDFMDGWYSDNLYVSRRLMVEGANPADSGAVEFYARFDANRDGYYDLFSSEYSGPTVRIWLGGPTGYSGSNVLTYPTSGGADCDMADLNLDGWPELISSGWVANVCRIFWGSQAYGGPDPANYTQLPHTRAEDVYVYDLDKDTYLDILLGEDYSSAGGLRVYWGSSGGYSPSNYSFRSGFGWISHNMELADLNKDGYPDVVMTRSKDGSYGGINILWGDATPRDLNDNPTWYHADTPSGYDWHGITLADFNKDGWLDMVVSQWAAGAAVSRIYFSDGGSFDPANMISLNVKECWGGSSAWDFNGDGWLDLLFFRGYFQRYPLLLCLNSGSPPYFNISDTVRTGRFGCYASGTVCDFNGDGKPDIFGNDGDSGAVVYWGVQATGTCDSLQRLLHLSSEHHSTFREPGNVYDRFPIERYESGIFSSANLQAEARLSWLAWDSVQVGSEVRMYIRTRWDGSSPWTSWRQVSNGETVSESPYFPARDIQYRAEFRWRNPSWLPWLERVNLTTSPLSTDEAISGHESVLIYGSGKGLVWVSWPGREADVSLYSSDGRKIASKSLSNGRAEFRGISSGVYYLWVRSSGNLVKEKVVVR